MPKETIKLKVTEEQKFLIKDCLDKVNHANSQKVYSLMVELYKNGDIIYKI